MGELVRTDGFGLPYHEAVMGLGMPKQFSFVKTIFGKIKL